MTRTVKWVLGLVPLVILLGGWQLFGDPLSAFYPPPQTWAEALADIGWDNLVSMVRETLMRFAVGILFGFVAGWGLGLLVGRVPVVDAALTPTLEFLRATPAPTLIPLIILFAGSGTTTIVVSVASAALWPILLNTIESARNLELLLQDTARTLQLTRVERVVKVIIPAATPGAFVGLRVALPVALIVTLLAEMLTGGGGLGGSLLTAQRTYATDAAYGLLVIAGVLGVLLAALFGVLESWLDRVWGISQER